MGIGWGGGRVGCGDWVVGWGDGMVGWGNGFVGMCYVVVGWGDGMVRWGDGMVRWWGDGGVGGGMIGWDMVVGCPVMGDIGCVWLSLRIALHHTCNHSPHL